MTNANIMRMSELCVPTLKEDPTDAEIASHKLLLISGTSLSHSPAREAVFHAISLARRNGPLPRRSATPCSVTITSTSCSVLST